MLQHGVSLDTRKVQVLTSMPPPEIKERTAVVPGYSQLPM